MTVRGYQEYGRPKAWDFGGNTRCVTEICFIEKSGTPPHREIDSNECAIATRGQAASFSTQANTMCISVGMYNVDTGTFALFHAREPSDVASWLKWICDKVPESERGNFACILSGGRTGSHCGPAIKKGLEKAGFPTVVEGRVYGDDQPTRDITVHASGEFAVSESLRPPRKSSAQNKPTTAHATYVYRATRSESDGRPTFELAASHATRFRDKVPISVA